MKTPSIKGTAFQSAFDDVLRLVAEGKVSRDELETRMTAEDLRLLDDKLSPASWYPMETFRRFVALLADKEARGRKEEYLVQRGWRAAERIRNSGLYTQLEATRDTWGTRVGKIVVTIGGVMYNFTRWSIDLVDGSVERFAVVVDDAAEFPDEARYTAQGFVKFASTVVSGVEMNVTSHRPTRDRVVFEVRRA